MTLAIPATVIDCSTEADPVPGEVDRATLEMAKAGDRAALARFVKLYEHRLFGFLSRMMGRGPHVEDMAQEVFIRAYQALPRFEHRRHARVSTWLFTIAARLVKDARKKRSLRLLPLTDRDHETRSVTTPRPHGPERARAQRELGLALEQAAKQLSEEQRMTFVLAEFHGMSMAEIAEVTSTSVNTVKTRLLRARARLRALMHDTWESYQR